MWRGLTSSASFWKQEPQHMVPLGRCRVGLGMLAHHTGKSMPISVKSRRINKGIEPHIRFRMPLL
jgi:hypothetical protein